TSWTASSRSRSSSVIVPAGVPSNSTYAGIVRLVEASRRSKAKLMRLADRFSVWFLFDTVAIAGVSAFMSGDMSRIVAVLVV
ncbi:heavy metal translocating P-type ATPase, partial [Rhizobium ruizarguesonis]